MANELQRFPVLRNRVDEVIRKFLRENLQPSETMIRHIVEMEVCLNWFFFENLQPVSTSICSLAFDAGR